MSSITQLIFNPSLDGLFSRDSDDKIVCPILLEEITEGSLVYRVECCRKIFSKTALEESLKINRKCPNCRKDLKFYNFQIIKDQVILDLKITSLFVISGIFWGAIQGVLARNITNEKFEPISNWDILLETTICWSLGFFINNYSSGVAFSSFNLSNRMMFNLIRGL